MKTTLPSHKQTLSAIAGSGKIAFMLIAALLSFNSLHANIKPVYKHKSPPVKSVPLKSTPGKPTGLFAVPSVSYGAPQHYVINTAISPLTPTSSGVEAPGYSGTVPVALGSGFSTPTSVALDKARNIYVTDYGHNLIKVMPAGGGVSTNVSSGFVHPTAIAIDTTGNIFIAQEGSATVYEIIKSTNTLTTIGSGFDTPMGLATDVAGNVYVADAGLNINKVFKIPVGGGAPIAIGTGFNTPYAVAVDKAGNVFVADHGNNAIKKIAAAGGATTSVITGLNGPTGVAVDVMGNVFAADNGNNAIKMKPVSGAVVSIGSGFSLPNDLAVAAFGNLIVADYGNNAIEQVAPTGGYYISPALPAGLNFNNTTGVISGTPTVVSPATNYGVKAYNSDGGASTLFTITVHALSVTYPGSPVTATAGVAIVPINPTSSVVATPAYNSTPITLALPGLAGPNSAVFNAAGDIYVSDAGNSTVKKFPAGGGAAVTVSSSINPSGLALDAAGNLYVVDYSNSAVKKFPAGVGPPQTLITGLNQPYGIALDGYGNIFIADKGSGWVKKLTPGATFTTNYGSNYSPPTCVATDAAGNVYLGNAGSGPIKMIPAGGGATVSIGAGFSNPVGIVVDATGNIYVSEQGSAAGNGVVKEIPAGGGSIITLSSGFNNQQGITTDANGNLYIADYNNHAIKQIKPAGGYFINALPAGLNFNNATGIITGIATAAIPATNYTVTAYNSLGSNSATVNITVNLPALPQVSYTNPQKYVINAAITPQSPATSNVPANFSYNAIPVILTAALNRPNSIAIDAMGNTYVTNTGNSSVQKIPAGGGAPVFISTGAINPGGVAIDAAGNIYIGDFTNNAVKKIPVGGGAAVAIGSGFNGPTGVAVDAAGNVYVADFNNSAVKKILAAGGSTITLGSGFNHPNGVAVDAAGNVYVADAFNAAVKMIPVGGGTVVTLATGLQGPYGVAVDAGGNVFVADRDNNSIDEIPAGGGARFTIGTNFNSPYGVAVDATGNIYVADYFNNAAKIIKPVGGYYLNPALPAGLSFNNNTGTISGTPTALSAAANYTVTVHNYGGSGSAIVNLSVSQFPPPVINYGSAETYPANAAITPLTPANSGGPVDAPAYSSSPLTLGSGFSLPTDVAVDAAGNVYVADRSNNAVKKIPVGGGAPIILGSGFSSPASVAVDNAGNVYVSDEGNNLVKKIPVGGGAITTLGTGFSNPFGIAVDGAGNVYVADYGNNAVKKIPVGSNVPVIIGSGFANPIDVAVDSLGNVYVADYNNGAIKKILVGGGAPVTLGSGFASPSTVAVDAEGNIYVGDSGNNAVKEIPAGGGTILTIGSGFHTPFGLTLDGAGNVYVADYLNSAVKKITPLGGYFVNALPAGLSFSNSTGIFTGTPTTASPATNYMVTAYNGAGSGAANANIKVTLLSSNATLTNLTINLGTLSPMFATATTDYTVAEVNSTGSVKITPTAGNASAQIKLNGVVVATGAASASIPLAVGPNTITILVTAQNGTTTKTYTIAATRAPSTSATLSALAVSSGTLSPVFAAGTISYTASVTNATTSITLTPTTGNPTATVKVNGTTVASGSASGTIALAFGLNTITTVVTAQDGTTKKTYTVKVTRAGSTNANLSALAVSTGTLAPAFNTVTTAYTVSVANATNAIKITPAASDMGATIKVNGTTVASGATSSTIPLVPGPNAINAVVTAQDGTTIKTYTVTVTRAGSTNATLSALMLSTGTLSPMFAAGVYTYTASVPNATSSIIITPTAGNPAATIKINGTTVASGTTSAAIPLAAGANVINTVVTAQDGTTIKTYKVTVTRVGSNNANLSAIAVSTGTLSPAFSTATTAYAISVANATNSIKITPTASDAGAAIKVNGATVVSGMASATIPLLPGANAISTVVTAQDGVTTKTYTITVTRAGSTNATLSTLTLSSGTLTPTFAAGVYSYTASVTNATASIKLTPTAGNPSATIKVNGTTVASGAASGTIALAVGLNSIATVVTAQDGTTIKTYTVKVTRAAPSGMVTAVQESPVTADKIVVHPGVSPNGDGIEDVLTIDGLEQHQDNTLQIISRNGALVYSVKGYDNVSKVFDGRSSITGKLQQPGTYFYQLAYTEKGQMVQKTGYILLKY